MAEDKSLKHLNRKELLEMLIEQSKELEKTKAELTAKQTEIDEREIKLDKAGSIADAALSLNRVFEAAQAAADQYVEKIHKMEMRILSDTKSERERILDEARTEARQIIDEAEELRRKKLIELATYINRVNRTVHDFFNTQPDFQSAVSNIELMTVSKEAIINGQAENRDSIA